MHCNQSLPTSFSFSFLDITTETFSRLLVRSTALCGFAIASVRFSASAKKVQFTPRVKIEEIIPATCNSFFFLDSLTHHLVAGNYILAFALAVLQSAAVLVDNAGRVSEPGRVGGVCIARRPGGRGEGPVVSIARRPGG